MSITFQDYVSLVDKAINIVLAKDEVEEKWTTWAREFVGGDRKRPPTGSGLEKAPPKYGVGIGEDEDAVMINRAVNDLANFTGASERARWDSYFEWHKQIAAVNLLNAYERLLKFVESQTQ